ncbi:LysR family transcriptional regulator, partial [Bacillus thuringiensis]|uniref:LysR family transcriptional regulator n=1 Tax=Bacillus thuringiensis TaxID=1428 RepID=UPI003BFA6A33
MIEKKTPHYINLHILKIFLTLLQHKHFSPPAQLLNLSHPPLTIHIPNLQNQFPTTLIQPSPNHLQLTQPPNILYIHPNQILSLYQHPNQEINQLHNLLTRTLPIPPTFTIP